MSAGSASPWPASRISSSGWTTWRQVDVVGRGRPLRYEQSLAQGANVNFVSPDGAGGWRVRTYERGVEGETLACGTGAVATAILLREHGETSNGAALTTGRGGCCACGSPSAPSAAGIRRCRARPGSSSRASSASSERHPRARPGPLIPARPKADWRLGDGPIRAAEQLLGEHPLEPRSTWGRRASKVVSDGPNVPKRGLTRRLGCPAWRPWSLWSRPFRRSMRQRTRQRSRAESLSNSRVRWIPNQLTRRMRPDAQDAVGTWFTAAWPQYAQEFSTFIHRH